MTKWNLFKKIAIFLLLVIPPLSYAENSNWDEFVAGVRSEALAQGIRPEILDEAFSNISGPNLQILRFERNQPEQRITFLKYRETRVDANRIALGRKEFHQYSSLLQKIEKDYRVNSCFVISLWGMETSYGHYLGNFPVIESLATLAYGSKERKDFFRNQLLLALKILNEKQVNFSNFKGEWAGASGHPQFLPSSWYQYAVDYNGDGKKDIWNTLSDVFASIANYLAINGWQMGQPWAIDVSLPDNFDQSLIDINVIKSVAEWKSLGVTGTFPDDNLPASIIAPDGGPTLMVFNNFKVIMKWNHSTYYAGTVGYLARQICKNNL